MATRAQKIRLAIFFLVGNTVLAAFLMVVVGSHLLEKRDLYHIPFSGISVSGLTPGAQVKYQGITVGRVEDLYISPDDITTVMVDISVDPVKAYNAIRSDTRAVIYYQGITGLKYVELIPGSSQAEILPPGSILESSETFLSDFERQAEVLSNKVEQLLDRVNLLLDDQNRGHVTRTLSAASELTTTAGALFERHQPNLNATFENMALASASLASASTSMQATMDSLHQLISSPQTRATLANIQATTEHLQQAVEGPLPRLLSGMIQVTENLDRTVINVDQTVLQSRSSLLNSMQDLEEALQNIRELSELVRENPSILIRGGSHIDGP